MGEYKIPYFYVLTSYLDIVDWPELMRDGYVMTNIDTVISAHAYHAASTLALLSSSVPLQTAANQLAKGISSHLFNGKMYLVSLYAIHLYAYFLVSKIYRWA